MYASAPAWKIFYERLAAKAQSLVDPSTGEVRADMVQPASCAVCGGREASMIAKVTGFTYVRCRACGFVYLDPQLKPDALAESYNDEDVRTYFFEQLLLPYVERDQEPEFRGRLEQLKALVGRQNLRLLDIGCAAGKFLMIAKEAGIEGEGLELNGSYVAYARSHRSVAIREQLLADAQYPDGSFDLVTLWDVLEHVPDPPALSREVARILKPGGVFALTTINHDCLNQHLLKDRWRYWMPPDHVCSFSPAVLQRILSEAGLEVVSIEHHAMFEVLADLWFPWFNTPSSKPIVRKVQKLAYLLLSTSYQFILNAIRSGDLLTVYARKP